MEHATLRLGLVVRRVRVHVDGEKTIVPLEEFLPNRSHENPTSHQEQESHSRHSTERVFLDPRRHRSPPQKLVVAHIVP